jgi:hypothetical protein
MSSRRAAAKRKRKQEEDPVEEDIPEEGSTEVEYTLFGGWLDDGYTGEGGVTEHEGFSLTLGGKHFDISLGDAVLMRGSDDNHSDEVVRDNNPEYQQDEDMKDSSSSSSNNNNGPPNKAGAKRMIARVERIWETTTKNATNGDGGGSGECPFMFQARWFLRVSIYCMV